MILTQAQIERFYRDGFLVVEQIFNEDEVSTMTAAFGRVHDRAEALATELPAGQASAMLDGARVTYALGEDGRPNAIRHISMVGNAEPELLAYGGDNRLVRMVLPLLGSREVRQMINQAHFKRPGTNVAFAWHQDSRHRGMGDGRFVDVNGRGSYVQIALALDDTTPDNGPLNFIRGSQRLRHIDNGGIPSDQLDLANKVTLLMKRGDVALFGPYTIHGSNPNTSDHWRRVFINGFAHPHAVRFEPQLPNEGRTLRLG